MGLFLWGGQDKQTDTSSVGLTCLPSVLPIYVESVGVR